MSKYTENEKTYYQSIGAGVYFVLIKYTFCTFNYSKLMN